MGSGNHPAFSARDEPVIRRTISYAVVTDITVGVFLGSVFLFQWAVGLFTESDSPIGVAASTLIAAAIFNPLRRRIQEGVDRRFFRADYDVEAIIEWFAAAVREETDLDHLSNELASEVAGALKPATIGVWVRER